MSKKTDDASAPEHKKSWLSFLKSIATFKGDLHSLTAPPFLLSPQSMTEFSTYWCERPTLFVAPTHEPDPEKRILLVLKWFISTLKEQHCNRDENGKPKKLKPLNPFLGEIFKGKWEDDVGVTNMISEQVSHHPPVTAYCIWNREHGIKLQGHVAPKVYFSSTINIERKDFSILHIDKYDEDYLITMPKVHVEGLISGPLFLELSGSSYIRSSSGYTTKIYYSGRGWLCRKKNVFTASIFSDDQMEKPLYVARGQWIESYILEGAKSTEVVEKVETGQVSRTPLSIAPLEKQDPLESRRAWQGVVVAINKGDIFAVGHEKSKIEMNQREMRKQENLSGIEFQRRYFSYAEEDVVAELLLKGTRDEGGIRNEVAGSSHGVWLASNEKMSRFE